MESGRLDKSGKNITQLFHMFIRDMGYIKNLNPVSFGWSNCLSQFKSEIKKPKHHVPTAITRLGRWKQKLQSVGYALWAY